ncbi:hypothetical protein MTR_4g099000 [Medicago truncatula]|uniref:Uncharacterized protein n=2 Tax=Medicago truncatula TaxID=3880 RepID=A0A072UP01_MEDTR|nr:hypothetical protein MTR_4g099000 [Medicago truncatula]
MIRMFKLSSCLLYEQYSRIPLNPPAPVPRQNLGKEHSDMKNMMNPDEDHHEHNNILMFIRDQNVCPEFQVKACGTQDTWHNTIGHPTTAI